MRHPHQKTVFGSLVRNFCLHKRVFFSRLLLPSIMFVREMHSLIEMIWSAFFSFSVCLSSREHKAWGGCAVCILLHFVLYAFIICLSIAVYFSFVRPRARSIFCASFMSSAQERGFHYSFLLSFLGTPLFSFYHYFFSFFFFSYRTEYNDIYRIVSCIRGIWILLLLFAFLSFCIFAGGYTVCQNYLHWAVSLVSQTINKLFLYQNKLIKYYSIFFLDFVICSIHDELVFISFLFWQFCHNRYPYDNIFFYIYTGLIVFASTFDHG